MNSEFDNLCQTIKKLRSPDGCPWDRKQTPETLRSCLMEECFETLNAIDTGDIPNVREELGDILLNVIMILKISFSSSVIMEKLITLLFSIRPKLRKI